MNVLDTPIEPRFDRITRLAKRSLGVPIVTISLVDADRQWFKSTQGLNCAQTPRDISFCGHAILEDEYMIVPDARLDPRFHDNPLVTGEPHIVYYAGVILRSPEGSAIGMLCAVDTEPREADDNDIECLRDLANMVQAELQQNIADTVQADLIAQIETEKREAMLDPLTRVWNRQGITYMLEGQLRDFQDNGKPFALMLLDLDHFKQVNDTHGHPAGDEVLREAAKRILGGIRDHDQAGRYGGEEFLVVFQNIDSIEIAAQMADRVRDRLSARPVVHENQILNVTLSGGVTVCNADNRCDIETLIAQADKALYQAKESGRNRVLPAEGPVSRVA